MRVSSAATFCVLKLKLLKHMRVRYARELKALYEVRSSAQGSPVRYARELKPLPRPNYAYLPQSIIYMYMYMYMYVYIYIYIHIHMRTSYAYASYTHISRYTIHVYIYEY